MSDNDDVRECPRSAQGHLPRFPVSWLNQLAGHPYECMFCGVGMKPVATALPTKRRDAS